MIFYVSYHRYNQVERTSRMNFIFKMMQMSTEDLKHHIQRTSISDVMGQLFKDTKQMTESMAKLLIENKLENYFRKLSSPTEADLNMITYELKKKGMVNSCFELTLLKVLFREKMNREFMIVSMQEEQSKKTQISIKLDTNVGINYLLIQEAEKDENIIIKVGSEFRIDNGKKILRNKEIIFILKKTGEFKYEFNLMNDTGKIYLKKQITPGLIYQIDGEGKFIRWLQDSETYTLVQVDFSGDKEIGISLKDAIIQSQYEQSTKNKLQDDAKEDQIAYIKGLSDKVKLPSEIVKKYDDLKEQIKIEEEKYIYKNPQLEEKYLYLCQGKIHNVNVASLGSMLEILKISENNEIEQIQKKEIQSKEPIVINNVHLHDSDSKAVLNGPSGRLHYYDLEKGQIVQEYDLGKGIQDICSSHKLAETDEFKTFKAITPNEIFQIDPRLADPTVNVKKYSRTKYFNRISVDEKGRFAVSSENGEIRLYDEVGENSNCMYPALGDSILHLDITKDGKWLLATFRTYLLLIPTQTEDDLNLYEKKVKIVLRPHPIKLKVKLQHIQMCRVKKLEMIPAKFQERKDGKQRFIVSGFGQIVLIWNFAHVVRGDVDSYEHTRINGNLVQTDFIFNNAERLLMLTDNTIIVQQNKIY